MKVLLVILCAFCAFVAESAAVPSSSSQISTVSKLFQTVADYNTRNAELSDVAAELVNLIKIKNPYIETVPNIKNAILVVLGGGTVAGSGTFVKLVQDAKTTFTTIKTALEGEGSIEDAVKYIVEKYTSNVKAEDILNAINSITDNIPYSSVPENADEIFAKFIEQIADGLYDETLHPAAAETLLELLNMKHEGLIGSVTNIQDILVAIIGEYSLEGSSPVVIFLNSLKTILDNLKQALKGKGSIETPIEDLLKLLELNLDPTEILALLQPIISRIPIPPPTATIPDTTEEVLALLIEQLKTVRINETARYISKDLLIHLLNIKHERIIRNYPQLPDFLLVILRGGNIEGTGIFVSLMQDLTAALNSVINAFTGNADLKDAVQDLIKVFQLEIDAQAVLDWME